MNGSRSSCCVAGGRACWSSSACPQIGPRSRCRASLGAGTVAPRIATVAGRAPSRALLDTYCVELPQPAHEDGGRRVRQRSTSPTSRRHAEVWEKAVRKLRGGMMPPPGARRPDPGGRGDVRGVARARARCRRRRAHPNPGRVALHRLNRAEYANAIEDLLGIRIDASALLPKDDEADGFDNVASVLTVSPSFLDQYISAARVVTARALGNAAPRPGSVDVSPGARHGSERARRGAAARHARRAARRASVSGRRRLQAEHHRPRRRRLRARHGVSPHADRHDRRRQGLRGADRRRGGHLQGHRPAAGAAPSRRSTARFQNIPLTVTAGPHKVGVTFIARTFAESDEVLHSFRPGAGEERIPRVGSIEIQGPFNRRPA